MSKKILLFCLLVAGMLCLIPTTVKAETSEDGEWEYEVTENDGELCANISDYLGNETEVTIPNTIDGYPVVGIIQSDLNSVFTQGLNTFDGIVTLTISDGIEQLGQSAFTFCGTLENIKIPATVTVIENSFYKCNNLINIEVDSDNESYASYDGALYNKEKTTLIKCPEGKEEISLFEGTTEIGKAFSNCKKLEKIEIPSGVITIDYSAFEYCESLTEVVIPESVTQIGGMAFYNCEKLEKIEIPNGVTSVDYRTFRGCTELSDVVIPETVTTIGEEAFSNCKLTEIKISKNVTDIHSSAFNGCDSLTIYGYADSYAESYANENNINFVALEEDTSNNEEWNYIVLDEKSIAVYGYKGTETKVVIPSIIDGYTVVEVMCDPDYIDKKAEENGFAGIEEIVIPDSVININDNAFMDCKDLIKVEIPDTVVNIGNSAFYGCEKLENIKIPYGVTVINYQTFRDCNSLTSINIPESVTSIEYLAFFSCNALKEVNIPASVTSIGVVAFSNCYSLVNIEIPNSVTSIGGSAFSDNPNLVSIKLPNNLSKIEMGMFANCSKLSYVEIPQSVKEIYNADVFYASDLVVIYGYTGSYAESFATENNIPFVALDELTDEQTKDVVCEGNTETAINTDEEKLLEMIFSKDELEKIKNGLDVYIELNVNDVTANVNNADKITIQDALPNGYNVEKYFDITLWSKLEDVDAQITETNGMVEIAITISLEESGTYKVIRVHNGKAEILPSEIKDGKLVFSTDKFSTYAIIHSEATVDVDTGNNLRNETLIVTTIVVLTAVIGSCYYKKKKIA